MDHAGEKCQWLPGGVALPRRPDRIALYDIVVAIDGDDLFEECVLGLSGCGEAEPCPLYDPWTQTRERLETMCRGTTLAEAPDVRLTPFIDGAKAPVPDVQERGS